MKATDDAAGLSARRRWIRSKCTCASTGRDAGGVQRQREKAHMVDVRALYQTCHDRQMGSPWAGSSSRLALCASGERREAFPRACSAPDLLAGLGAVHLVSVPAGRSGSWRTSTASGPRSISCSSPMTCGLLNPYTRSDDQTCSQRRSSIISWSASSCGSSPSMCRQRSSRSLTPAARA